MSRSIRLVLSGLLTFSCLLGSGASASDDWELYARGDFGLSWGFADARADFDLAAIDPVSGSSSDSSGFIGGAFGVAAPVERLTPWRMPSGLHRWTLRGEIEAIGLRDHEYTTGGFTPITPFHTNTSVWTLMTNFWLDLPVQPIYRPYRKVFGRAPRFKRFLEPISWYFGAGIGLASLTVKPTDNQAAANETDYNFAWQAGTGFGYEIMERVTVTMGYRYVSAGKAKLTLLDPAGNTGRFDLDQAYHEFTTQLRWRFYTLPDPWR